MSLGNVLLCLWVGFASAMALTLAACAWVVIFAALTATSAWQLGGTIAVRVSRPAAQHPAE